MNLQSLTIITWSFYTLSTSLSNFKLKIGPLEFIFCLSTSIRHELGHSKKLLKIAIYASFVYEIIGYLVCDWLVELLLNWESGGCVGSLTFTLFSALCDSYLLVVSSLSHTLAYNRENIPYSTDIAENWRIHQRNTVSGPSRCFN